QRQRRYLAAMRQPTAAGGAVVFDSNCITTGTAFMRRLDAFLDDWLRAHAPVLPPTVIYSSHADPGEGEHKIMHLYRTRPDFRQPGQHHILYGLDADLIVLSLLAPLESIYLIREDSPDYVDI